MNTRILSVVLLLLLTFIPSFCLADDGFFSIENGIPMFGENDWFSLKSSQVEDLLKSAGYNEDPSNMMFRSFGVVEYKNSYVAPYSVTLLLENNMVSSASMKFKPDRQLFADLEKLITDAAGEPEHTKQYTENFGTYTQTNGESLKWKHNGYAYKANGEGGGEVLSKISQIRSGSHSFVLTVQRDEGYSKVTEKMEDVKPAAGLYSSSYPTNKGSSSVKSSKSTTSAFKSEVKPISGRIEKDSIGNPDVYIAFRNEGSSTVDRVDFAVKCFDAYGDEIKQYGIYDYIACFYEDKTIGPNKSSPRNWSWVLYGVEGTRTVKVAVTKYHTTDGKTVEIPEKDLVWKKF